MLIAHIHFILITLVQEFKGRVGGVKVKSVDTTGAGDSFVSGLLYNLASDLSIFQVSQICTRNDCQIIFVSYISRICTILFLLLLVSDGAVETSIKVKQRISLNHFLECIRIK